MKDILLTTVCNDEYVLGAKVMLYSMKRNINNLDRCDFKIYYNDTVAPLSEENKESFRKIIPDIIIEHVDKECYLNSKIPYDRNEGSKAAYLTLESFNETDYNKVILFDVDMLCIGDISDLFDTDLQFGIWKGNTGFVVLGKKYRNQEVYDVLTSKIQSHNGDFMDQGIINAVFRNHFEMISRSYNQYPLSTCTDDTRILHWAHYDHVKPWKLDEWKDKIDLFLDEQEYRNPASDIGNIPTLKCKPFFDLWKQYETELDGSSEYN